MKKPLIKKIDCVQFYVSDLESGIKFYHALGHSLKWRTDNSAGFQMPETDAEIVIQTNRREQETDLLVDSVDSAIKRLVNTGARLIVPPFEIQVGKCAVIIDPWGNKLVLLDLRKGTLRTDSLGRVVGHKNS
jgi:lactoylglutathione lyase